MLLPARVQIGALDFAPRHPTIGARIAYHVAYTDGGVLDRADVSLSVLHIIHPSPPWTVERGADLVAIGRAVSAWCDAQGLPSVDVWNVADTLGAEMLASLRPPTAKAATDAEGFSAPRPAPSPAGDASLPESGAATDSAGSP